MRTENGKIDDNLIVAENFELNGMVTGSITVQSGKSLDLNGVCAGDLVVETGASANVSGMVAGDIVNSGAVELLGLVQGNVRSKNTIFKRSPKAVIMGSVET
jgi:cytoskeletal protein CcmA (bactofilin family)